MPYQKQLQDYQRLFMFLDLITQFYIIRALILEHFENVDYEFQQYSSIDANNYSSFNNQIISEKNLSRVKSKYYYQYYKQKLYVEINHFFTH